jgi:hypothetical protein
MCQHFSGHKVKQFLVAFQFYRGQVAVVRMEALSVVEDFDVVKDGFFSRFKSRSSVKRATSFFKRFSSSYKRVGKIISNQNINFVFVHDKKIACSAIILVSENR